MFGVTVRGSSIRRVTRRGFVGISISFVACAAISESINLGRDETALSVEDAHHYAMKQQLLLVDIRRPDEWAYTGVGEGAIPLDMRRKDFLTQLMKLVDGDKTAPIAVICARGVRSKWLSRQLVEAGFTRVIDVPEGMLGSRAGPGWLRVGLPMKE